MVGRTLGSYRLNAHIGSGGMGDVYAGEHVLIGRRAAIKVLLPEFNARADLTKRFFNEAKAAASAQHPGIVEVYDFGNADDGTAYLVMELLEGESLWQKLRREIRLPEREALVLARQIAGALSAAHLAGIIHRDLKPGNIFLIPSDEAPGGTRVKLMDFGVAKLVREQPGDGLTSTGIIVGTPTFMSPEQCRGGGGKLDWRSDLYSLGCILFSMLTGRPPYVADGAGSVLAMHIYEPVPRVADHRQVSIEVDSLVSQLLAKRPEDRARDIRDISAILAQLAPTEEGRLGPSSGITPMPPPAHQQPTLLAEMTPVSNAPAMTPPPVHEVLVQGMASTATPAPPPWTPMVAAGAAVRTAPEVSPVWPDGTPTGRSTLHATPAPGARHAPAPGDGRRLMIAILALLAVGTAVAAAYALGVFGRSLDQRSPRTRANRTPAATEQPAARPVEPSDAPASAAHAANAASAASAEPTGAEPANPAAAEPTPPTSPPPPAAKSSQEARPAAEDKGRDKDKAAQPGAPSREPRAPRGKKRDKRSGDGELPADDENLLDPFSKK